MLNEMSIININILHEVAYRKHRRRFCCLDVCLAVWYPRRRSICSRVSELGFDCDRLVLLTAVSIECSMTRTSVRIYYYRFFTFSNTPKAVNYEKL